MIESLFSPQWYRVSTLQPRLKPSAEICRQTHRQQLWYVLRDPVGERSHRFTPIAYEFISLLDGRRSIDEIWHLLQGRLGDDCPGQVDIINVLSKLYAADVLLVPGSKEVDELLRRGERREQAKTKGRYKNPAALRFRLFDPQPFLVASHALVKPFFSAPALILYGVLIALGAALALQNWSELSAAAAQQLAQPYNLALLLLLYPVIKLLHELGHAWAVTLEGGEVHELGVMLLVLMPIPYVDASASAAFPRRRERILVSAAGMLVELVLSALALFLWLIIEPGLIRDALLSVMLIGGASTLFFNGNPLLRYDAYYILSDWIGISNLAQRSNSYLAYLFKHYLFGIKGARSPLSAPGERRWFLFYSIASFFYRTAIMLSIALYLASQFFYLGLALAIWVLVLQLLIPALKTLSYLGSAELGAQRNRAWLSSAALGGIGIMLCAFVPLPSNSQYEGVVWMPGEARIHSKVDAFVHRVLAEPGQHVEAGELLIELSDPLLDTELELEEARVAELQALLKQYQLSDQVKAQAVRERLTAATARRTRAIEQRDSLLVFAEQSGEFILSDAQDQKGRFVHQGELLAMVRNDRDATVRLMVSQADVDRIQQNYQGAQVRLSGAMNEILDARLVNSVPQAKGTLPSDVLSTRGGGKIALDANGEQSLERLFEYELELPVAIDQTRFGARAHVRFDHGQESFAAQSGRRIRQLFLSELAM